MENIFNKYKFMKQEVKKEQTFGSIFCKKLFFNFDGSDVENDGTKRIRK